MNDKMKLRLSRAKRATKVRELFAGGMNKSHIAMTMRISNTTVTNDLKSNGIKAISRNTWKDASVMLPPKEGWYWVCFINGVKIEIPQCVQYLSVLSGISVKAITHWCGPITIPKYDPAEIKMEKQLRSKQ
jgi:hypothetical protein